MSKYTKIKIGARQISVSYDIRNTNLCNNKGEGAKKFTAKEEDLRADPQFARIRHELWRLLREEVTKTQKQELLNSRLKEVIKVG